MQTILKEESEASQLDKYKNDQVGQCMFTFPLFTTADAVLEVRPGKLLVQDSLCTHCIKKNHSLLSNRGRGTFLSFLVWWLLFCKYIPVLF